MISATFLVANSIEYSVANGIASVPCTKDACNELVRIATNSNPTDYILAANLRQIYYCHKCIMHDIPMQHIL